MISPKLAVRNTTPPAVKLDCRICTRTVMDTTDPDIVFDEQGVSNWWHDFQSLISKLPSPQKTAELFEQTLARIRRAGRGRKHDCIVGLSGGVDSSYVAYLAKQHNLRALVVHFDNGWNNELAVHNIEKIVSTCDFPLKTHVMDWPEFRDLQRAYFKASVIDLEVPTDHMIFAALNKIASREGIKFILSGNNLATEWLLPAAWYFPKGDLANLMSIHRLYGERTIKNLPKLGAWRRFYFQNFRDIETIEILNLVSYRKLDAKQKLISEFGWRDYGGKHYESIFTRFYQGYILPTKFGIDKRKAHLSNLILNNEIEREQAIEELKLPTYAPDLQQQDKAYVAKKLGWSTDEFENILHLPNRPQDEFGNEVATARKIEMLRKIGSPFARLIRALTGV